MERVGEDAAKPFIIEVQRTLAGTNASKREELKRWLLAQQDELATRAGANYESTVVPALESALAALQA